MIKFQNIDISGNQAKALGKLLTAKPMSHIRIMQDEAYGAESTIMVQSYNPVAKSISTIAEIAKDGEVRRFDYNSNS